MSPSMAAYVEQQAEADKKDRDSRDRTPRTQEGENNGQRCLKSGWQKDRKSACIAFTREDTKRTGVPDGHSLQRDI